LSPERADPFKDIDKTPDLNKRSYSNILQEQKFKNKQVFFIPYLFKFIKVEEERKIQKLNEE
jgi:splicing factor 3B subunit 1